MPIIHVTKRNGEKELIEWSKVDGRLNYLNSHPTQLTCNASFVADRVRESDCEEGIDTKLLDERSAKVAADLASQNPDFLSLSSRISVSNHHKNTLDCFSSTMDMCYRNRKPTGRGGKLTTIPAPRINSKIYKFVQLHKNHLNRMVDYNRDYRFTDFGFAALMDRYLIKRSGPKHLVELRPQDYAIERPQDMWMRVSCAIHMNRDNIADESVLKEVQETYDMLSEGWIMHATPTLYNAGTLCEQLLSCYLMGGSDSIEGIGKIKADMLKLSKHSGGIGWWWPLRSSGSEVSLTNGTSGGPEPFLRGVEADMKAANQGGKRPGSAANYEQPAHPDIMRWLKLKRGDTTDNIDKLFYALWIHDEFMQRVVDNALWYFVDPHEQPALYNMVGEEYSKEYARIISEELYKGDPIPARDVLLEACETQAEAGMPYMSFADAVNQKSNQKNIGVIRSSNLCVAGDTPILTDAGWINIDTVTDQVVKVWNGDEFTDALVKQTSDSAHLIEIETSDGCIIRCTPEHEFIVSRGARNQKTAKVAAKDMKLGQKLAKIPKLPVMDNGKVFPYAYTSGAFSGDGTIQKAKNTDDCENLSKYGKRYCGHHMYREHAEDIATSVCQAASTRDRYRIDLYGDKHHLEPFLAKRLESRDNGIKLVVSLPYDMPEKFTVPINYGLASKLEWLAGMIDTDGCLSSGSIQICSIDQEFLLDIKLMCQTMGINPIVSPFKDAGQRELPDGRGGKKFYDCKKAYRLLISGWDTWKLYSIGLTTHRVKYTIEKQPQRDARSFVTISKIEKLDTPEKTYCFGEPKLHQGMFGGLLTGNCNEITLYSSPEEYACCAVSSVCLPKYVRECDCLTTVDWIAGHVDDHQQGCNGVHRVDYERLAYCAGVLTKNLNKITDINYYPVPEAHRSQTRHRPLAVGIQGLADLFHLLKYPFESSLAQEENKRIFESIYYGCVHTSMELAQRLGPYETFLGDPLNNPKNPDMPSPFSQGILQFDMWGVKESELMGKWDWTSLKQDIQEHGMRNSMLTAIPPTASTSHIQGNNECTEPFTDNIYVRKTLSGENLVINNHLVKDLVALGLWTPALRAKLVETRGSVRDIEGLPERLKQQYKTVWEMDNRVLIDMDAARGPFIDQTQSSNRFMDKPTAKKLFAMHIRCWRKGLKTGMYYLRSQSQSKPTQFSETVKKAEVEEVAVEKQSTEQDAICYLRKVNGIMCASCT